MAESNSNLPVITPPHSVTRIGTAPIEPTESMMVPFAEPAPMDYEMATLIRNASEKHIAHFKLDPIKAEAYRANIEKMISGEKGPVPAPRIDNNYVIQSSARELMRSPDMAPGASFSEADYRIAWGDLQQLQGRPTSAQDKDWRQALAAIECPPAMANGLVKHLVTFALIGDKASERAETERNWLAYADIKYGSAKFAAMQKQAKTYLAASGNSRWKAIMDAHGDYWLSSWYFVQTVCLLDEMAAKWKALAKK